MDTSILQQTQDFLTQPYPTDKNKVYARLNELSKLRLELALYNCDAKRALFIQSEKYRRPQEKGITDFDRRIMLQDMTAEQQYHYDLSSSLLELLSDVREDLLSL